MTELSYKTPEPGAPSRGLAIRIICWILILTAVGFEVYSNAERSPGSHSATAPEDNPMLPLVGRYVVGAHLLMKSGQVDMTGALIKQLDDIAKSPGDQLRVAIISKEVEPPRSAQARLGTLQMQHLPAAQEEDLKSLLLIYQHGPAELSADQREKVLDREGWFGRLALSHGLPDTVRVAVISEAQRTVAVMAGAFVIVVIGIVFGVGLMVTAIVLIAKGKLVKAYQRGVQDSVFLEAFTIYLLGFILLSLFLHFVLHVSGLGWSLALTIMLPIAMGWPVIRGRDWASTMQGFGWHTGKGIFIEFGLGIVGYIAALPLLAIAFGVTAFLVSISGATPSHPIIGYVSGGPSQIVLIYILACIWAPIFEETMFRGALFHHLRGRHGWWISASIVGLIFAAIHPQGWTLIPMLGGIGMVLCGLREWRGSIIASMAAHALNNFTMMTLLILAMR